MKLRRRGPDHVDEDLEWRGGGGSMRCVMERYIGNVVKWIKRWWLNKEGFLSFLFYFFSSILL
jgi:hypothetical protein